MLSISSFEMVSRILLVVVFRVFLKREKFREKRILKGVTPNSITLFKNMLLKVLVKLTSPCHNHH